ncbi:MAG: ribonuclease III [Deltaproteobacteria bacterium]|nr:ribonuclease III [Deltaproteobacteria bacterium]
MPWPPADDVQALEERLGYTFLDRSLLDAALSHSSALPSGARRVAELLEFLGDAVLDLIVADLLLRHFPELDEGELSKRRAMLVRTATLATKARGLGLDRALRLGRGEDRSGGRAKASILAHVYEAVLGAVFRDGGFARVRAVITRHFAEDIARGGTAGAPDWKTLLQERTQASRRTVPEYRLAEESGPAHARRFTIEVWVDGACRAVGSGTSKRAAEQEAARVALEKIEGC